MLTARRHRLSPFVHVIDDLGSLCGAAPRDGRWIPNTKLPVSCPTCLVKFTAPRYVFCGVPSTDERKVTHIRLVGPEGVTKAGLLSAQTLCHQPAGWDVLDLVGRTPAAGTDGMCTGCIRELRRRRTGLDVDT